MMGYDTRTIFSNCIDSTYRLCKPVPGTLKEFLLSHFFPPLFLFPFFLFPLSVLFACIFYFHTSGELQALVHDMCVAKMAEKRLLAGDGTGYLVRTEAPQSWKGAT